MQLPHTAVLLTARQQRSTALARRRLDPAAVAAPAQAAAGTSSPDAQQYQGRAGRAQLWRDINADEYPEGGSSVTSASGTAASLRCTPGLQGPAGFVARASSFACMTSACVPTPDNIQPQIPTVATAALPCAA